MKKVYGYVRVSTAKQGLGVSLIEQKEAIIRYATKYNLEIIQWFEEKETAAKLGRPLFNTLLKLLKARKATGVIIHKIDRSARNLKDWADLGNLIDQGIEVHFAHESLDLQARGGRLSADIQAVIAADYIRNLRQEAIKGLYGRLKQGIYPFHAPIGYLNTGQGKVKTIDPIQGPLVKKAFTLYATKKFTLKTLSVQISKLGMRNLNGKDIDVNNLSRILNNPYYAGVLKVKGTTYRGSHEPLISPSLYKTVQAILKGNGNQKVRKHNFKYRKLLSCNLCGYSLIGEKQKGNVYYRCHTSGCLTKGVRETYIENSLVNELSFIQLTSYEYSTLTTFLNDAEENWEEKEQELRASLKLSIGQLENRLERLTDCYIDGGLEKELFEKKKTKLLLELKTKEASEKEFTSEKNKILEKTKQFLELSKSLISCYKIAVLEEQREIIEIITSNLKVEGKKLTISMQSPFLELTNRGKTISCRGERITSRTLNQQFTTGGREYVLSPDVTIPPVQRESLSKEDIEKLFQEIQQALDKPSNKLEKYLEQMLDYALSETPVRKNWLGHQEDG